jgi:hypothetical protein
MNEEISRQTIIDNEHINLLSMFHLISGILALLYSVFMALYFGFIIFVFKLSEKFDGEFPIQFMGVIISIWIIVLLFAIAFGIAKIFSSKWLKQRKNRTFSIVISCIECFSFPYGAILGVLSIIVLNRSSVKSIYSDQKE